MQHNFTNILYVLTINFILFPDLPQNPSPPILISLPGEFDRQTGETIQPWLRLVAVFYIERKRDMWPRWHKMCKSTIWSHPQPPSPSPLSPHQNWNKLDLFLIENVLPLTWWDQIFFGGLFLSGFILYLPPNVCQRILMCPSDAPCSQLPASGGVSTTKRD